MKEAESACGSGGTAGLSSFGCIFTARAFVLKTHKLFLGSLFKIQPSVPASREGRISLPLMSPSRSSTGIEL